MQSFHRSIFICGTMKHLSILLNIYFFFEIPQFEFLPIFIYFSFNILPLNTRIPAILSGLSWNTYDGILPTFWLDLYDTWYTLKYQSKGTFCGKRNFDFFYNFLQFFTFEFCVFKIEFVFVSDELWIEFQGKVFNLLTYSGLVAFVVERLCLDYWSKVIRW